MVFKTTALPIRLTPRIRYRGGISCIVLRWLCRVSRPAFTARNMRAICNMRVSCRHSCLFWVVPLWNVPTFWRTAEDLNLYTITGYWQFSKLLPYRLGLAVRMVWVAGFEPAISRTKTRAVPLGYTQILVPETGLEPARDFHHTGF